MANIAVRNTFCEHGECVDGPFQHMILYRNRAVTEGVLQWIAEKQNADEQEQNKDCCSEHSTVEPCDDTDDECVVLSGSEDECVELSDGNWSLETTSDRGCGEFDGVSGVVHAWSLPRHVQHVHRRRSGQKRTKHQLRSECLELARREFPVEFSDCTTLVLQRMSGHCSRDILCRMLASAGFSHKFDFLYVPFNFQKNRFFGYGLINFVNHTSAAIALEQLNRQNFKWPTAEPMESEYGVEPIQVSWSRSRQGLSALVQKYRNSPVMHEDVPEAFKPIVLRDGSRTVFPAPTEEIQAPPLMYKIL